MSERTPGRRAAHAARAARRSLGPAAVLAVLLPLLTLGGFSLVRTETPRVPAQPPELTALTRVSLGCPSSPDADTDRITVGSSLAAEDGAVTVDALGQAAAPRPLDLRASRLSTDRLEEAAVVTGEDQWAPGLLAARLGRRAATACVAPWPETWFAGVGARPGHSSVVELVNPDSGPAIADLTILAPSGPLDVPDVRGVRVPGRSSVELDLARISPRRTELAVQVVVSRGRLVSSVWDTVDELGAGAAASDWLTAQPEPVAEGVLLGLPAGPGSRRLTLVNGGDDETRVRVRVISPESTFEPQGLEEIRIPPASVRSVSLDTVLGPEVAAGATGLLVEATDPVSAGLRSFVDGDLAHTVIAPPVLDETAALVPSGAQRLLLAGALRPGVATVVARAAGGRELATERLEIGPDRSVAVRLPEGTAYVAVQLSRTEGVVSVLVTSPAGVTVVPLRQTVRNGLVPQVGPARP